MSRNPERRWWVVVAAILVAMSLGLAGCQSHKPIVVDLTYLSPDDEGAAQAAGKGITVHLSPVADERSNRDTIGRTTVPVLPGSDVITWVRAGLLTLDGNGFALSLSGSDPVDGYRLRVATDRVYCRSTGASLRATVVLSVEYYRNGDLMGKRQHHGEEMVQDHSLLESTYKFNDRYVLTALNGALSDVVDEIAATLLELEAS